MHVSDHGGLLRARDRGEQPGTALELFLDLVFVFAVTQLSHRLLEHLTIGGALETLVLLVAVWRAWVDTTWVTNWFDPDRTPVRLLLIALVLVSLVMSVAIPQAFGEGGLMFAIAYVTIQVGRTAFVVLAPEKSSSPGRNIQRYLAWFAIPAVLWVAGGLLEGEARYVLWVLAVVLEYAGPVIGFWTPGLGGDEVGRIRAQGSSTFASPTGGAVRLHGGPLAADASHSRPAVMLLLDL